MSRPVVRRSFLAVLALGVVLLGAVCVLVMQPVTGGSPAPKSLAADPARLEAHVRMLSTTLAPRDYESVQNLDRAAAYLRQALAATGGVVTEQDFVVLGRNYRNVIASFGPTTTERIVVGAHYDAAGKEPGADDNASGVAGLLELARLLQEAAPRTRVELVAFTLEEPPFYDTGNMGSARHAERLAKEGAKLKAMISLEMIGYFSDAEGSQRYPLPGMDLLYPSKGDFIAVVGDFSTIGVVRSMKGAMAAATPLPVWSLNGPAFVPGVANLSDHMNYQRRGYRAVMVTDTSFYRNPHYHLPSDTADRLDYKKMAQVVQGVHAALIALGG
jgi:hypothetical protein